VSDAWKVARILVVEDEPSIQRLVRLLLEQEGHVTEGATTGPEALERLGEHAFNMVVLDLMLGPFSGWQVLREMERLSLRRRTKVLVLTARNSERDILHGWRMGADSYVTKPFDPDHLLDAVNKTLRLAPEQLAARRASELERSELLFQVQQVFAD
jgi:DNA-binding response OmpR family regulator